MSPVMLRAILFDLDGIIIDSSKYHAIAWQKSFKKQKITIKRKEPYDLEGAKKEDLARTLLMKHGYKRISDNRIRQITETKSEIFLRNFKLEIFERIAAIIRYIKKKRMKCALVTGSSKLKEVFSGKPHFLNNFDVIITGKDTENGKPSAEPYLKAIHKLKIPKDQACVIENAPLGVQSAKRARLFCIAVKGNAPISMKQLRDAGADIVVENMSELARVIRLRISGKTSGFTKRQA